MTFAQVSLIFMAAFYFCVGVLHMVKPKLFLKIIPPYLPKPLLLVFLSGVAEMLLGIGLMIPATQTLSAWGVILLLIAVFPANLYMYQKGGAAFGLSDRVLFWRLPIQLLLILWAYFYT